METKNIYEIYISTNPKVGYRLFKRIRATEVVKNKYVNILKAGFYVYAVYAQLIEG